MHVCTCDKLPGLVIAACLEKISVTKSGGLCTRTYFVYIIVQAQVADMLLVPMSRGKSVTEQALA
jgi:hypothetical protein